METNTIKLDDGFKQLISRQNYLVTQRNDLARAFGNLTSQQHKLLDYCLSFIQPSDNQGKTYVGKISDIIKHLGINNGGRNYQYVAEGLRDLLNKTSIYIKAVKPNGTPAILMTHLFDYLEITGDRDGSFEFQISKKVAPYVFQLKENYYSFHLAELSTIRSKYSLILLKLWNANGRGTWHPEKNKLPSAIIQGSLDEWEKWFLGNDKHGKPKKWAAGRFHQQVLGKAIKELKKKYPNVEFQLAEHKSSRKIVGFTLTIIPKSILNYENDLGELQ